MPLAAIICATAPSAEAPFAPRGQLHFAGQSLMEYQARQARDVGVEQVMMMVDAVTPALSRAVDALGADGIKVHLIRDMATLVRDIPRDCDVLLFADGAIVDQRHVDALAQASGNALLVVEDTGAAAHFERIDGMHRWVGVARLGPDLLFGTLDLIGDWDFSLTLLRASVQANARRITVPGNDVLEGRVALVDRQATANLVAQTLLAPSKTQRAQDAGAEYYLLRPMASLLSARFVRMQIDAARVRVSADGIALIGLLLLYPGWYFLAALVLLAALTTNMVADQLASMARRSYGEGWLALAPIALVLPGIVTIGAQGGSWDAALYLACLVAIIQLAVRWGRGEPLPKWAFVTPGSAVFLLLIGLVLGSVGTLVMLASLGAMASVAAMLLGGRNTA